MTGYLFDRKPGLLNAAGITGREGLGKFLSEAFKVFFLLRIGRGARVNDDLSKKVLKLNWRLIHLRRFEVHASDRHDEAHRCVFQVPRFAHRLNLSGLLLHVKGDTDKMPAE